MKSGKTRVPENANVLVNAVTGERTQLKPSVDEKLTFDIKIGFGTFRAGCKVSTLLSALERHNLVYKELIKITPAEKVYEIIKQLND